MAIPSTAASCFPASIALGQAISCTATVTDIDSVTPTGAVAFTARQDGDLLAGPCDHELSGHLLTDGSRHRIAHDHRRLPRPARARAEQRINHHHDRR